MRKKKVKRLVLVVSKIITNNVVDAMIKLENRIKKIENIVLNEENKGETKDNKHTTE